MIARSTVWQVRWLVAARHVLATALVAAGAVTLAGLLALHDLTAPATAASATLWLVIAIAGLLGAARAVAAEDNENGLRGLLLAPVDRRDLFLAHAIAIAGLVLATTLASLVVLAFVFPAIGLLSAPVVGTLAIGALAIAPIGAITGWASLSTRAGELVALALAVPLAAPILVSGLHATQTLLTGHGAWTPSVFFAAGYGLAVGALTYIVADPITEVAS